MPYGYHDRVLKVDLSTGKLATEALGEPFWRRHLGGRALIAYYLAKELPPGADPLGPENLLILAPGVVTGAAVSGQGRNGVGAKSPLTGGVASAEVGGFWGAELKRAGFDAIVFKGRAEQPVYLWVHDGQAELRDAAHLWGKTVAEAEDLLQSELNSKKIRTCLIGPAGENRVRYACVVNDRSHFAGRGGLGAVMGSKNLKGVAALAPQGRFGLLQVADPRGVLAVQQWMGQNQKLVAGLHEDGTAGGVTSLDAAGGLPTHNFQFGSFAHAEQISGQRMTDEILVKRDTCAACSVRCKRVVALEEPYKVNPLYGGPEYESLSALGNNCGIGDLYALAKANELCAAYGLDSISLGAVIAFAMECWEKGLLTAADTGGVDLSWGNVAAMFQLLDQITFREGIGDLLAEGVARAAQHIGQGAEEYAMHVKGQELPMHEPRIKHGLGLGYAVSPTGADHMHNIHDVAYLKKTRPWQNLQHFGNFETIEAHGFAGDKVRLLFTQSSLRHALDCMVMCHFLPYDPLQQAEIVRACTGWDMDHHELLQVGIRASAMCRMFNLREGFGARDDGLPRRMFEKPEASATGRPLDPAEFDQARRAYYGLHGWDEETGVPTAASLEHLGLAWMA